MITGSSIVVAAHHHLSTELDGEAVVLDTRSGTYYTLGDVGAYIWRLLAEARSVDAVVEAVVARYDVTPDECRRDVLELMQELRQTGLIEVKDAAAV